MDVILLERVHNLGQIGDVVKVRPGYARNFLLPMRKALRATEANRAKFESQRAQIEAMNLEKRSEAEKVKEKVDGLKVVLIRQAGETGQLFGSVNARDLAVAVTANVAKSTEEAEAQEKAGGYVGRAEEAPADIDALLAEVETAVTPEEPKAAKEAPEAKKAKETKADAKAKPEGKKKG